ncbi:hypothetical protein ACQKWADRAFT_247880 [Trichoderma austrokoningii]
MSFDRLYSIGEANKPNKTKLKIYFKMSIINRPIFKEIAKIQKDTSLPPSLELLDYQKCRAYTQSGKKCKNTLAKDRGVVANLLSDFRQITNYGEVDSFYDQMAKFIEHTHCYLHKHDALEAFTKWKTERIAAAPSSSSTLATNAVFSSDSPDTSSEISSVASPTPSSPVFGSLGCNPSTSGLCIEEAMRNLALNTTSRNAATRRSNDDFDRAKKLRDKLRKLGTLNFPDEDAQKDPLEIYRTIKNPPSPKKMYNGIIYIYKHTKISGILKIGYTGKSAQQRQRQSGNCYGIDTDFLYETKKPFGGAYQAERIIHAVLKHKQIQIYNCSTCGRSHHEWFLTSEKEARDIVKCAESWLRMPAYTLQQGKFKLSPPAEVIYGSMFGFSLTALKQHIGKTNASSNAFSVNRMEVAIQEIEIPASVSYDTKKRNSTGQVGRTSTTALPMRSREQVSAIKRAGSALQIMDPNKVKELTRNRSSQSTHSGGDEDYSDDKEPQESSSGGDYSEVESQEFDSDEEGIEEEESEELDSGEEYVEDEDNEELDSDEEFSEAEELQEPCVEEDCNQAGKNRACTCGQATNATTDVDSSIVKMLKEIRKGGAIEFKVIFPS